MGRLKVTRPCLETAGFTGWLPFAAIRTSDCPASGGVYVVTNNTESPISFSERSCGGWFKGKDPTVGPDALATNWVDGAEVVYIGKADQLIVGWKETPGRIPVEVEAELIASFRQIHGKPPFANDPHRLGG
ncbi:MAG: hypothetical protein R3E02_11080 [Blastomonas sp.]